MENLLFLVIATSVPYILLTVILVYFIAWCINTSGIADISHKDVWRYLPVLVAVVFLVTFATAYSAYAPKQSISKATQVPEIKVPDVVYENKDMTKFKDRFGVFDKRLKEE